LTYVLRSLVSEQSVEAVLARIANDLREVVSCDDVVIWELAGERRLTARHVDGEDEDELLGFVIEVGKGITGTAVLEQRAILSNDAHLDPRAGLVPGTEATPEAIVCIPLTAHGIRFGALSLYRCGAHRAFGDAEVDLIENFAHVAAIALHNARTMAELERQASTDDLTGLSNRRHFHGELRRQSAAAARYRTPLSLLLLDVDNFKQINDEFGHQRGDEVLRAVANILSRRVRVCDLVSRLGGDEFAILLPQTEWDEAVSIAADIEASLDDAIDLPAPVKVSIGMASCSAPCTDLLSRADHQLYVEKRTRQLAA